jgi:hypothetical protein
MIPFEFVPTTILLPVSLLFLKLSAGFKYIAVVDVRSVIEQQLD